MDNLVALTTAPSQSRLGAGGSQVGCRCKLLALRSAIFASFCVTLAAQTLTPVREAALGKQLADQARRFSRPVGPQAVQDYVSQLDARLAAELPSGAFPKTFSVVDVQQPANPLHEPVVLPGGYVFVPLGLLLTAQDEAEFAGMLTQGMAREPLLEFVGNIGNDGTIPMFFFAGFPTTVAVPLRRRQVEIELEADDRAAAAMARAGFDPAALPRYIEREQRPSPFSQLPPRAVRIDALRTTIAELAPRAEYIENSSDFSAVQKAAHAEGPEPYRPRLIKR